MRYFKDKKLVQTEEIKNLKEKLVKIRRAIHAYPETGFEEEKTAELIIKELEKLGIKYKKGVAKTGVVGFIEGKFPGPTVALRADMDALNLQEETDVPYASKRPGIMHACGHDGHVAMLIGAAELLMKREFAGNVKLFFQPAEEGPGGAEVMIEEGVLNEPSVKAIIAGHLNSSREAGIIGVTPGQTNAASDELKITLFGKGGHAARPNEGKDTIVMAAEAIVSLQKIVSRMTSPLDPVVLTIGKIRGGSRHNIIASKVVMEGTIRSLSPEVKEAMPELIKKVLKGVTDMWGGRFEMEIGKSYPSLFCDKRVVNVIQKAASRVVGEENVIGDYPPTMGGEDFAFFTQKVPGAMFRLGGGGPDYKYTLHHPKFDFNEDALVIGSAVMAEGVLELLEEDWVKEDS